MKTLILFLALLFSANLFSQEQNTNDDVNHYLQKSHRQKKTANILLITSGVLIVSGAIIAGSDENDFLISAQQFTGMGVSIVGIVSGLASIPFYVSSTKNKSKNLKISPEAGHLKIDHKKYLTAGLKMEF